jgi:hypothetical protein
MTQVMTPVTTGVDTPDSDVSVDALGADGRVGTLGADRVVPATGVAPTCAVSDLGAAVGVPAVLVERDDGTCVLYSRGPIAEWPSIDDARSALHREAPRLVWRETTAGVWIGRPDRNEQPVVDRGTRSTRRVDVAAGERTPPVGDSYMTARVLRGQAIAS